MGKGRKGRAIGSRKAKLEPPMTLEHLKEIEDKMNSVLLRKGIEVESKEEDNNNNKPVSVSDLSELTTYGWYKPDTNLPPIPEYPYSNKRLP